MTTELTLLNPTEYGLTEETANELIKGLPQILSEREPLIAQYEEVIKLDIENPETAARASELRRLFLKNRTKGIEPWHKTTKEYFLRGGQFVDAMKNKEVAENTRRESALEEIEKYAQNKEKERKEAIQTARIELIKPFVEDVTGLKLSDMDEDVWDAYFTAKKSAYDKRMEEIKLAEEARIAKEREEEAERERICIENETRKAMESLQAKRLEELLPYTNAYTDSGSVNMTRLWEETEGSFQTILKNRKEMFEKMELEAKAEKEEAEAKLKEAEEKLAKEKRIADEKLAAEQAKSEAARMEAELNLEKERTAAKKEADRIAAENESKLKAEAQAKANLEAELKAIEDERILKAKKEQQEKELADKEAAKLAKAPIKKQLNLWVESFVLPETNIDHEQQMVIEAKFLAFKAWAKTQVEAI